MIVLMQRYIKKERMAWFLQRCNYLCYKKVINAVTLQIHIKSIIVKYVTFILLPKTYY